MKKIFFSAIAISTLFFSYSCNTDFDTDVTEIATTNGEADFSKYVALGNSLTAGYRDNALYISGQNESYPNMIAQQMKAVGGGEFKQPLMADDLGGIPSIGRANKLVLSLVNGELSPVTASGTGTTTLTNIYASGPYQNMGVPGAKVSHLLAPGYGSAANLSAGRANPYFVRFASSATTSVIADFISQKPTFFSLWIGNNDALLYALAGGDSSVETLTSAADFKTYYTLLATQIATTGAKGIVANIPDVTAIPSLTTVPYNPLSVSVLGSDNIDKLNQRIYGPLKQVLTALGAGDRINLLSKTENNPLLIKDESLTDLSAQITAVASRIPALQPLASYLGATYGQVRQAKTGDLVPLTTRAVIGTPDASLPAAYPNEYKLLGVTYPLQDKYVLTATEVAEVSTAIKSYNETISEIATKYGYAFVDANAKLAELAKSSGIQYDGVKYTTTYVSGGAFSLDGVHLTGRGYAIIANEFIKAINKTYKSNLAQVNPNNYSGVTFP